MGPLQSLSAGQVTPTTPPRLRLHLLGPFECLRAGESIAREAWRTRQTLNLLKLLLDERDHTIPFDRLIDTIWPDSEPTSARHSLRVAIQTLRHVLEPALTRGTSSHFIRTQPEGYRFVSQGCAIDVETFLGARQRALAARRRADVQGALQAGLEAAALYRGEYFADEPYAEWAFSTRERLQADYLDVLDLLSDSLIGLDEWEQAIVWIERALALDPLSEEHYRRLMRCHLARGRRSHALAVFERCRRQLRADLGIEPAPETLRLRAELVTLAQHSPAPAVAEYAHRPVEPHLPFVGRLVEGRLIARAWARAQQDAGQLVVVSGLPGIGKTRLVQQITTDLTAATARAPEHTPRLLWISCYEAEQQLPFAPLARLLAPWLERPPTPGERRRLEHYAPVIAQLLPQARSLALGGPLTVSLVQPAAESSRLLEALTQVVRVLQGGGSSILVADDLHWADASTLLWLEYALHRFPPGTLIMVTQRSSEPEPAGLRLLRTAARRAEGLTDVALTGLIPAEVDELLANSLRDPEERRPLSRRLHELTGGQPLLVVETVRELLDRGLLYTDGSGGWRTVNPAAGDGWEQAVPSAAVREMVDARVERLDEPIRRTFAAVCVIGVECNAGLVAAVTGDPTESALSCLDVLLERQLLRATDDGRGYAVAHPLIQRAVYDGLSPGRRQVWHLRVARALQKTVAAHPASSAGQVLRHLLAADAPGDEIIQAAELAGDHALAHHAFSEALECYTTAQRLLAVRLPEPAARQASARIGEQRAESLSGSARWIEAITCYEELIAGAGTPLNRSRLRRKLARVQGDVSGHFDEALALLAGAEAELVDTHAPEVAVELGRIAGARAGALFYQGKYRAVLEQGTRALELWRGQPGVERDEIELMIRLGTAEQRLGLLDQAETRFRTNVARMRSFGDRPLEISALENLGGLLALRGELTEALALSDENARTAAELGIPRLEIIARVNCATRLAQMGDLHAARTTFEQVIQRAEIMDARYTVMHALVGLGEILVRIGDFKRARLELKRGITLAEEIGNRQRLGHAYLHLAELALLDGDAQAAHDLAARGISIGQAINDVHALREGYPLLAQALTELGDHPEAERAARFGLEVATNGGFVLSRGRNLLALGQALAAAGRPAEADVVLTEAEQILRLAGARYDLAYTLYARATTTSDGPAQAAALAEARRLARAAGARPLARRIAQASARTG